MPSKKKSKGVLERIGDVASSAAEVVVDASSKAMHAVGDLMPGGSSQKGTKAPSKASKKKAPKASRKSSRALAKSPARSAAKASNPEINSKTKTVRPKAAKPAIRKSTAAKPATGAAKAAPKRRAGYTR